MHGAKYFIAAAAVTLGLSGAGRADPKKPPEPFVQAMLERRYDDALSLADVAVADEPSNPWSHFRRGEALERLRRYEEARGELGQAENLFRDPRLRSMAVYVQAHTFADQLRCDEATMYYERFASLAKAEGNARDMDLAHRSEQKCWTVKRIMEAREKGEPVAAPRR